MPIPQWLAEALPGFGAIMIGVAGYTYVRVLHDRMMRERVTRRGN